MDFKKSWAVIKGPLKKTKWLCPKVLSKRYTVSTRLHVNLSVITASAGAQMSMCCIECPIKLGAERVLEDGGVFAAVPHQPPRGHCKKPRG